MFNIISQPKSSIENPYISVVVIAYDRKEFIQEAVKSAINQTLERSKYEIIVVKNYLDDQIDEFLNRNNVMNIYSDEKTAGSKLAIGIQNSRGEVISFLEDDDLFLPLKLREVYEIFKKNKDIVHFKHNLIGTRKVEEVKNRLNEVEVITSQIKVFHIYELNSAKKIFRVRDKYDLGYNSSISIRRSCYKSFIEDVKGVNNWSDLLFFFLAFKMHEESIVYVDKKPLSIYRIHDSWSRYDTNTTFDNFVIKRVRLWEEEIAAFQNFIKIILSTYSDKDSVTALIRWLTININVVNVQLNLTRGSRSTLEEILSLIQTGMYQKNSKTLLPTPLIILSPLTPKLVKKIFMLGLASSMAVVIDDTSTLYTPRKSS